MRIYFQQSYPSTDVEIGKKTLQESSNSRDNILTSSMPFVSLNSFAISQATESQLKIVWSSHRDCATTQGMR